MPLTLAEYHNEFFQTVYSQADAHGTYAEDAFFDLFAEHLTDAGELETAERAHWSQVGIRIDGYGGDPLASDSTLSLIVLDFNVSPQIKTLTSRDMDSTFKRLENYLRKSLDREFRTSLEETSPAFGLSTLIARRWTQIAKVRLFLITNRQLSGRIDGRAAGELDGKPLTYNVWDIQRLHINGGSEPEELRIDLEGEFGGPISALPAHLGGSSYKSYLAAMPGWQLASIYDRWGTRLLEQNVRVFLQARGNINRGIRNTLDHEPEMFFAYNNGITATAEDVETKLTENGVLIKEIKNFQIVNGGQTTASIHAKSQSKESSLEDVFVQMKLSIIPSDEAPKVVPKISEYANSQNRVNAADFFSNHPFHVRMEGFSRRLRAPAPDGSFIGSKWFYERARGQYQDARAGLRRAERRKFDSEYPRKQLLTKTDLAKFVNVWKEMPHIVSRGAQKNFAQFAQDIARDWERDAEVFNEEFYRTSIAKAILFKEVERIVSVQPWYQGGYRANIVAYTIAKLSHDLEQGKMSVDYQKIWNSQSVPSKLHEALVVGAGAIHQSIIAPPPGSANISEWAKQPACWDRVKAIRVKWPASLEKITISNDAQKERERNSKKAQRLLDGIEAQTVVVSAGADFWGTVISWGQREQLLSEKELEIMHLAASVPDKLPSEKQSEVAITALKRLEDAGFKHDIRIIA